MNYCFIYNPRAGPARDHGRLLGPLQTFIARHRLDATVIATTCRGHATELAAAAVARGCDAVIAVGGDGTMNEVARALVDTPAALGLVPRGSGNGLARHLGIPMRFPAALDALLTSRIHPIDSGEANGRSFFSVMGTGFDTAVLSQFELLPTRGFLTYVTTAARLFFRYRCGTYALTVNGESLPPRAAFLVCVANGDQLGNNARLAPGARLDDGRLDLVIVPPLSIFSALPAAARLFAGSVNRVPGLHRHAIKQLVISRPQAGPMQVDGELVNTSADITVCIRPASLRVLVPVTNP